MKVKQLVLSLCLAGVAAAGMTFSTTAFAQEESLGERGEVLACFYECKEGPLPDYWVEVTSLMLINAANRSMTANVILLDGNGSMIAIAATHMSPEDLDEINICRTFQAAGIFPPSAGMIEVVLTDPAGLPAFGTYGWVKNVVGKFFKTVDEPFQGRVNGIGKTECRVVPPNVTTAAEIFAKLAEQNPPHIFPILIEGTDP